MEPLRKIIPFSGFTVAYPSYAVANELLLLGREDGISITPMKLQKLVFYANGWYLAVAKEPLIHEQVECWKYGPVVSSLFHHFKEYGSEEIRRPAVRFKKKDGRWVKVVPKLPQDAVTEREIIKEVWDAYKSYSGVKLSNMTHAKGTPWEKVYSSYDGDPPLGTDIPSEEIRQYFESLLETA